MEASQEFFTNGEFWAILIKVLITTLLSAGIGLIGTLIGRAVAKHKDSKIYKYAKTCVDAAEMKYPNEGKKMGPEKMAYVMDQMAIKFPKIKESTYFYNIAEAAVLELNRKMKEEAAVKEFEEKYGEKPFAVLEEVKSTEKETVEDVEEETPEVNEEIPEIEVEKYPSLQLEVEKSTIAKSAPTNKIRSF